MSLMLLLRLGVIVTPRMGVLGVIITPTLLLLLLLLLARAALALPVGVSLDALSAFDHAQRGRALEVLA
jgi:hypothetical protein